MPTFGDSRASNSFGFYKALNAASSFAKVEIKTFPFVEAIVTACQSTNYGLPLCKGGSRGISLFNLCSMA
jgi:hypothetical protein